MPKKEKAAPEEQHKSEQNSTGFIIPHDRLLGEVERIFPSSQKPIKIIQLKGYSYANKKKVYENAKKPLEKEWTDLNIPSLSNEEIQNWERSGGWIGLVIPDGYDLVDIDDTAEGELIYQALLEEGYQFHAIKTPNGYQFFFRSANRLKKQNIKVLMAGGFVGDYRLAGKGQIVLPSGNTPGRQWVHICNQELSFTPVYFYKLKNVNKESRPFPIPVTEGSRNDTLYKHSCRLIEFGYDREAVEQIARFLNAYFFWPPMDENEFKATLKSAFQHKPSGTDYGNVAQSSRGFNLTDYGNAQRFVNRHGDKVRYCHPWKKWLIWNGKYWEEDLTGEVVRMAKETARRIFYEAAAEEDDDKRKLLFKHAEKSESAFSIKSMITLSQSEPGIPVIPDALDSDEWVVNVLNGTIDLKTGILREHRREDLISKIIPVAYDANARCPTWEVFLNRIMDGNENLIRFLQKAIGYTLTGSTKEQCLFFFYGTGANGKSVFLNTIKELLGNYGMQIEPKSLMVRNGDGINNDIARLKGARFVAANEGEDGQKLAEGLIKSLTGSDPITARFLHAEYFTFIPTFKIFFSSNHKPRIRGTDEGIWRRIRLIPFAVTIPEAERDKHLPERLRKELPGILRWAVNGCLMWQREGLAAPLEVQAATDSYRAEMDVLASFIEDCCVINPLAKVQSSLLYRAYQSWCDENGEYPISQRVLGMRLKERGFDSRKANQGKMFFFGVGMRTDIEQKQAGGGSGWR